MDRQAQRDIRRKLNCLRFAQERGSNVLAYRKFGVSKSSFYRWKAMGWTPPPFTASMCQTGVVIHQSQERRSPP
jgi:hypothetical protein